MAECTGLENQQGLIAPREFKSLLLRHLYREAGTYSLSTGFLLSDFCTDLESWNSISRKANFNIIHRTQIDIFPVI